MDTKKLLELKNSLTEIRETAELLELKLDKYLHETNPEKIEPMRRLIESAINLLQFEFKRTLLMDTGELKDYFSDL
jgi:hypothetical protein